MTKRLKVNYPSIADILRTSHNYIAPNNQGIDTIQQIVSYVAFKKMADKLGLTIEAMPNNKKLNKKIADEIKADSKKRLTADKFTPIVERIKLPKVDPKDKALYISIVRNTPTLFDVATHHKKAKDSFCLVTYAGLHQPTKKVSGDAMKIISKFLRRKTFKVHSVDIAIDTKDHRAITNNRKETFKSNLMPYSKQGVIIKGSSLYINNLEHHSISRIIYYDKYLKQLNQQKKEIITDDLNQWKRLEITLTFDVTKKENKGFTHYIDSINFIDDLYEVEAVAKLAGIENYDNDFLVYQLNSFIDNRTMNNHESQKQFNSVEALERFKQSEFRRYLLPI